MIICNNIQETIDSQNGEIVTIGFSEKEKDGLHKGHQYLIDKTKEKYPDKTLLVAVWSNRWRNEKYPLGYEQIYPDFDKQYMIDWFDNKVDIISFIDKDNQTTLFNSIDLKELESWVNDIFIKNKYSFDNKGMDSFMKWAMLISKTYEVIGWKRNYVVMSNKDGRYNKIIKHFYEKYISSIKEVFMIDPLMNDDNTPFSTRLIHEPIN